jgi:transketolase
MRWEFGLQLYELMKRDERTFLLWMDVGAGIFKRHREDFPTRCLNVGVREQATVSMAAGMAMQGFRPICYTILPFLIERAFEQIKIDVDQMRLPVGLVGHSDGNSGPTHQELNAPVLMGLCKNIRSYFPATKAELADTMQAINLDEPWFLKLSTL